MKPEREQTNKGLILWTDIKEDAQVHTSCIQKALHKLQ